MRRKDKEINDQKIIAEILDHSEICRLGLVDESRAYIVPVNYAHKDGAIYIHSAMNGKKIELLKTNNQVSFEIEYISEIITGEKACEWTARYRSAMGHGSISIETDTTFKKEALDLIMRKYGATDHSFDYDEALLSRVCILKLTITSISGKQSGDW
jgi:nitroimidazol reductase NimA-like FMN-containing flavoprotein (pyridoxamine 5'-phosphate oxidase superfamily)